MRARGAVGVALFLWPLAIALCPISGLAQPRERGATREPDRLLVLEPVARAVYDRIAGQTADLPWKLERVPGAGGADPLRRAAELGGATRARAVLWVERNPATGYALYVYDTDKQRLLERDFNFDPSGGALSESAALEALALAMRSALRALSAHEALGEAVPPETARSSGGTEGPEQTATPNAGNADQRASAGETKGKTQPDGTKGKAKSEDKSSAAETPRSSRSPDNGDDGAAAGTRAGSAIALALAAGWDAAIDGPSPSPLAHGPFARLGIGLGRLELTAQAQTSLPHDLIDRQTRVRLQRTLALAGASFTALEHARFALAAGASIGAAWFARTTTHVSAGLTATGATDTPALAFGLELRARFVLVRGASARFGLELAATAMALPAAPVLRYDGSDGRRVERAFLVLEPALHAGPYLALEL